MGLGHHFRSILFDFQYTVTPRYSLDFCDVKKSMFYSKNLRYIYVLHTSITKLKHKKSDVCNVLVLYFNWRYVTNVKSITHKLFFSMLLKQKCRNVRIVKHTSTYNTYAMSLN